uniref:Transcription factor TFIIIC triple barrel domain-containing protein n=1 Tax=Cacopsylla melanoneura TaxID=428564 RepID=A0A8D9E4U6_9HEMI
MSSDSEDLTEEEEVEEKLIFMELDNKQTFEGDEQIEFLGLEHTEPVVNINGITYKGCWEDALGTLLVLDGMPQGKAETVYDPLLTEPLDDTIYEIKHKTDKILKMSRCVIVKNQELEPDLRQVIKMDKGQNEDSSEEENIEEAYAALNKEQPESGGLEDVLHGLQPTSKLVPPVPKSLYRFSTTVQPKRKIGPLEHLKERKTNTGEKALNESSLGDSLDQSNLLLNTSENQQEEDSLMNLSQNSLQAMGDDDPLAVIKTESPDTSKFSQMSVQSLLEQSQNTLEDISNCTFMDSTMASESLDRSSIAGSSRELNDSSSQANFSLDSPSCSKFAG